jgi:alkylmercury lyase
MISDRVTAVMQGLLNPGGPFDYTPTQFRLVVALLRTLAAGQPVTPEQVARLADEAGMVADEATEFLRPMTERDAADHIVGAFGLSLNEYPHRFLLDDTRLSTWCAEDALFLPLVLGRSAVVESPSPVSGRTIRVRVSSQQVEAVEPAGAVLSLVIVDPVALDGNGREAVQGAICEQIQFFASPAEVDQWAAGRNDIEILSVAEGYELARLPAARFLGEAP